jgi:methylglutaconyl-CoA hydratase
MDMQQNQEILVTPAGDTCIVCLNRPDKGNALTLEMIRLLLAILKEIEREEVYRFVVLKAVGINFCTGADLNWMSAAINLSENENLNECIELAALFATIYTSDKIYIAQVNGPCYGGGVGLTAACDFVFATREALFSFSEVKLGLVPAIITPYIIYRTGAQKTKISMLTGESVTAEMALRSGLIDFLSTAENIEHHVSDAMSMLRLGGRNAQHILKKLVNEFESIIDSGELKLKTAEITAKVRVGNEASEGIRAFLEKRAPNWRK